jgi:hypothetical protein
MGIEMKINDRVKVNITRPDFYARGCAECLNGKEGKVQEVKNNGRLFLVAFFEPAKPWHSNQLPVSAFHFSERELIAIKEGCEVCGHLCPTDADCSKCGSDRIEADDENDMCVDCAAAYDLGFTEEAGQ